MSATKMSLEPTTLEIQPGDIMQVLFVEHDMVYRQTITRDLENMGCRVDGVNEPYEAIEKLSSRKYQMVIFDIGFPSPSIPGDKFIVLHQSIMRGAQLIALTGQRHNIRFINEFNNMGVVIIDKGEEDKQLQEISQEVYTRAREDFLRKVNEAKTDILKGEYSGKHPLAEGYLSQLEDDLLKELEKIEDKESKTIHYKGKTYSVSDLIDQVRQKTDIGSDLTRMMLNLTKWREAHAQRPRDVAEGSHSPT